MATHNEDSVPEMVQLNSRLLKPNDPNSKEEFRVELLVNPAQLEISDRASFEVSLAKLTLSLNLSGFTIDPGSKRGEPTRPAEIVRTRTIVHETSATGQLGTVGGLNLGLVEQSIKLEGSGSASKTTKDSVSTVEQDRHIFVRARGNDTWEVTEPPWEHNNSLDAKYLNDDVLCCVTRQDRANLYTADLMAYARQRDLHFAPKQNKMFGTLLTSRDKLVSIFLTKAMARECPYQGYVTFSRVVIDIED